MFSCLFLPAVQECDAPSYPYEFPAFTGPYVLGLVFALIALARTRHGIDRGIRGLRIVLSLMILGGLVTAATQSVLVGLILLGVALILTGMLFGIPPERRIAAVCISANAIWALWFGLWCMDSGAMIGVYLSFASSLGLLVAGVTWLKDTALTIESPDLARATVISSDS